MTRRAHRAVLLVMASIVIGVAACAAPNASAPPDPPSATASSSAALAPTASSIATSRATPAVSAVPLATLDPTPEPTPTPWKKLTSKRYRYTVKYPPTWVVTRGSKTRPDAIDDHLRHYLYLQRDTVAGTVSLSRTVSDAVAHYKRTYEARVSSSRRITHRGLPGRLLTLRGTQGGREIYVQSLILAKDRVAYFVELYTPRGEASKDKALFKKIWRSFRPTS